MKRWIVSSILVFAFSGCIQTDLTNCPSEVSIDFEYTHNTQGIDLLDKQVHSVSLLVFDHNDIFRMRIDKAITPTDRIITFDLDQGVYRFVALGNLNEDYEHLNLEPNVTHAKDVQISVKQENKKVKKKLSLFHAELVSEKVERLGLSKKMSFVKNNKAINVSMIYPISETDKIDTRTDQSDLFTISTSNGTIDIGNNTLEEMGYRIYVALSTTEADHELTKQMEAHFSTLQLKAGRPLIYNTWETTKSEATPEFSYDLMTVIDQTPVDLLKVDTFNIVFNFSSSNISTITVNGWEVSINNGDVGIE